MSSLRDSFRFEQEADTCHVSAAAGYDASFLLHQSDIHQCVVVTEIGAERDDLALSTMTSNIFRLLQLPVHG